MEPRNFAGRRLIRISFEALVDELGAALRREGFAFREAADFQREFLDHLNAHFPKYKVFAAHSPRLTHQMLAMGALPGIVVPCYICVVENYPGTVEVALVNPSAFFAGDADDPLLHNLAIDQGMKLQAVITSLEHDSGVVPDLVTSWG